MAQLELEDVLPVAQYTVGLTATDTFTIPFEFFKLDEIRVFNQDVEVASGDFTVNGTAVENGYNGGSVVLDSAVTSTKITVLRDIARERLTNFPKSGPFDPVTLNTQIAALYAMVQEVDETLARCIKAAVTVQDLSSSEFALEQDDRKLKFFAFDANGDLTVSQEIGTYRGDWTSGTAYVQRDLVRDASNGNVYFCNAGHTSSGSTPISGNADAAKWDLIVDAVTADASKDVAVDKADEADNHALTAQRWAVEADGTTVVDADSGTDSGAYSAKKHAGDAAASASAAATSESNAATSESNAASSAADAAASYDLFDDRFLGAFASPPTTDNDGDPLVTGALYFDTSIPAMQVWNGTAWGPVGSAQESRYVFTATAGQTAFSGLDDDGLTLSYTVGQIDPYLNGVRLNPADYTASDGSTITLAAAASAGDVLYVVSFGVFEIANVYTKPQTDDRYLRINGDQGPVAFRNWIINGNFTINQRGAASKAQAHRVYGYDRWQGTSTPGQLRQYVEALPAGEYTLSWKGGGQGKITNNGTAGASPVTETVTAQNLAVFVPDTATEVQLERGPVATPFEHRPIGIELALCQRYFQTFEWSAYTGASARVNGSNEAASARSALPVKMRVGPTVSGGIAGDGRFINQTGSVISGNTAAVGYADGISLRVTGLSATVGTGHTIYTVTTVTFELDAEL